jgi:hypothetical protein
MRKIRIVAFIALLVAVATILFATSPDSSPQEPRYKGRKLSRWLYTDDGVVAVTTLGTNTIPIALKWLSKDYSSRFASFHKGEVAMGAMTLRYLGRKARPAVPALIELTKHRDQEVRSHAFGLLLSGEIYPGDEIVRPVLLRLTNDPSHEIRLNAAVELAEIDGYFGDAGPEEPTPPYTNKPTAKTMRDSTSNQQP